MDITHATAAAATQPRAKITQLTASQAADLAADLCAAGVAAVALDMHGYGSPDDEDQTGERRHGRTRARWHEVQFVASHIPAVNAGQRAYRAATSIEVARQSRVAAVRAAIAAAQA